jgi:molybdopterin-guanine dinucleotide biosynthesis protein A/molybdopterin converting factor small subunit
MRAMETADLSRSTAVVLAGGRSSRMGTPKALLLFDGEPLISHIVAMLRRQFADVVVVAAPGQDLPTLPVNLVHDQVAYQGPVGGLCYGLAAAREDVCFVTSCDSAFLNASLIAHLVSRIAGHDVVVPRWDGRFQPLHAVYRRAVLPVLEGQLARGELRPVFLFDKVQTLSIDEEEIRRFDPDGASFFNMNTPEDYERALKCWRAVGGNEDDAVQCTVELFGVARMLAKTKELSVTLPAGATLSDVFGRLSERLPILLDRVITADRRGLVEGYACNVNGRDFVRTSAIATATVHAGDTIVILSADAGG